jgi:choline dehydrogenase-like flavoprotein
MRSYGDDDEVDFAIVGTGAGGGTLTCNPASAGFRVVAFDAGPFWRPLEDFASDEKEQQKLYWQDERIPVARIRFSSAPATAARVWVAAPCISPC